MRSKNKSPRFSISIPLPIYNRMLEHAEANGFSLATLVVNAVADRYGIKISPTESRRMHEATEKENARVIALAKEPFSVPSRDGLFYATDEDWLKMDAIMDACRATGTNPCWSEYELDYYNKKHP